MAHFSQRFTQLLEMKNRYLLYLLDVFFYSLIFSLIFSKWAHISTFKSGTIAGIYLGILYSISMNFFMYSSSDLNVEHFITDVLITTVSTAIMCGAIGYIIGKTKE